MSPLNTGLLYRFQSAKLFRNQRISRALKGYNPQVAKRPITWSNLNDSDYAAQRWGGVNIYVCSAEKYIQCWSGSGYGGNVGPIMDCMDKKPGEAFCWF